MTALICLHVPDMTTLYYGTLILSRFGDLCFNNISGIITERGYNEPLLNSQIVSELPSGTNLNFEEHWYPKLLGLISASSFHGKLVFVTLRLVLDTVMVYHGVLLLILLILKQPLLTTKKGICTD